MTWRLCILISFRQCTDTDSDNKQTWSFFLFSSSNARLPSCTHSHTRASQWPWRLLHSTWRWLRTSTTTLWGGTAGLQTHWIMSTSCRHRYTPGKHVWKDEWIKTGGKKTRIREKCQPRLSHLTTLGKDRGKVGNTVFFAFKRLLKEL